MIRFAIISILLFFSAAASWAQQGFAQPAPKREVRAIWLTTIGGLDWPHNYAQTDRSTRKQQQELCLLLDKYQKAGINTVLMQTRIRGTMIYPSVYEPWDGCLSGNPGVSPGYDALAFAIKQCHKRGMELHAWVVTIPLGKWNATGCARLRKNYPRLVKKIGDDGYMDPENSATGDYLAKICEEIVRNYDVDGIHLDYIRYPENWKAKIDRQVGRKRITDIVRKISRGVKDIKPWVKMSCSPIGKHDDLSRYWSHGWNAYTTVCQDAQAWLRDGLMDQLYPMMYFRDNNFYPFAIDWAEQSFGKMVVPGLGIYFLSPKEGKWTLDDVSREMYVARQYGMGHAFFRGKFFTDNTKGIYDFAATSFDRQLALVPAMTWECNAKPGMPTGLRQENGTLSWNDTGEEGITYNVYSSMSLPVDTEDGENLVAVRLDRCSIAIDGSRRHYAVTAMNRYGVESEPLFENYMDEVANVANGLLPCDGRRLSLPKMDQGCETDMVIFATMQGCGLKAKKYQMCMDVADLPNGMYVVRSVNARGMSHKIGTFLVRRENGNGDF